METYQNILVVIDEQNFVTKAISRAVNLIKRTHGRMNILLLENNSEINRFSHLFRGSFKHSEHNSFTKKISELQLIINSLLKNKVNIEPDLLTCNSYNEILTNADNKSIDTVVLAASSHDFGIGYHNKQLDSFLIGRCPIPVLVVKDHNWELDGHILSAVELFNDDPEHQTLTKKC